MSVEVIQELHGVTLRSGSMCRLDNVSLTISSGVTAVLGPSGAGKTSLLNILTGMERPSTGSVTNTTDSTFSETGFGVPVYAVPQDGGLWPHWNVRRHLEAVADCSKNNNARQLADKLLNEFDLTDRQHAFPEQLSMGERSRLALARALAVRPKLLVMDEPLVHVAPDAVPRYRTIVGQYLMQHQASLIFATHEPEYAISRSQRVICMSRGKVNYVGSTRELYDDPPDEQTGRYLGPLNWFTSGDPITDQIAPAGRNAFRPETVRLLADDDGPLVIRETLFHGSYAETTIEHRQSASQRTIYHRPAADMSSPGQSVRLEIVV